MLLDLTTASTPTVFRKKKFCLSKPDWLIVYTTQSIPQLTLVTPLSPNIDENKISLCIITTCSSTQAMRIKETIAKDKMS